MQKFSLRVPNMIADWLNEQASNNECSISHAAELAIRNGMVAHIELEHAIEGGDNNRARIYREVAYRGFGSIRETSISWRSSLHDGAYCGYAIYDISDGSPDLDTHIKNMKRIQANLDKTQTGIFLTEGLATFLRAVGTVKKCSVSSLIFMYIQNSILAEFWADNIMDAPILPPELREPARDLLREHARHFADFVYDESGGLHVRIEKKTKGPSVSAEEMILNMSKKKDFKGANLEARTNKAPRKRSLRRQVIRNGR